MINFFRRIRKKLADDNQFFKYARYAVGEIVLVVIGILIALQINTWNEQRKESHLEIGFLKSLKSDLVTDSIYYKRRIKDSKNNDSINRDFIRALYTKQQNYADVKKLFVTLNLDSEQLTTQNTTYLELINDGKLNLIQDTAMKSALINYYRETEVADQHIEEFNAFSAGVLLNTTNHVPNMPRLLKYDLNLSGINFKFKGQYEFVNDPYSEKFQIVEDLASVYVNKNMVFLSYFDGLMEKSTHLIELINVKLEN